MNGKERVARMRREINEARESSNPTHAATVGIEAIASCIEDLANGTEGQQGQPGSEAGMGKAAGEIGTEAGTQADQTEAQAQSQDQQEAPANGAQTDAEGTKAVEG